MAVRTWAQTLGMAAGAAFLAAASQLGVGSGLGLLRWDGDFTSRDAWHTQLTWLAFLTALATVAGAAAAMWAPAGFLGISAADRESRGSRAALCAAAAVGAITVIPVGTRPAQGVHIPEPGSAGHAAILAMLLGALLGLGVAYATLTVPAVAGNVVTYAIWLWIAALTSSLWSLGRSTPVSVGLPTVQSSAGRVGLIPPGGGWTATVLLLSMPAVIAFGAASVSRFGGGGRLAVAGSGAAGPALVAGAYVIGGRGAGTQSIAYWCALGGVAVGAAVSAFVALARRTPRPAYAGGRYPAEDFASDDGFDSGRPRHGAAGDRDESWDATDEPALDDSATWYPRGAHSAGSIGLISSAGRMEPAPLERAPHTPIGDHAATGDGDGDGQPDGDSRYPGIADLDAARSAATSWYPSEYPSEPSRDDEPAERSGAALVADLWSTPATTTSPAATSPGTTSPGTTSLGTASPASTTRTVNPWPEESTPRPSAPVEDLWSTPAQPARWEPAGPSPSSRALGGIFESAPAPEVPTAPASRNRAGSLFDAPPPARDAALGWDTADDTPGADPAGASFAGTGTTGASFAGTGTTGASFAGTTAGFAGTGAFGASPADGSSYGAGSAGAGGSGADLAGAYPTGASPAGSEDWSSAEPTPAWDDPDSAAEVAPAGQPAWAEHLSGAHPVTEPEPAPTGKQGKRGRRKGETAEPPVVRAKDAEYVDWFKDLRGSGRSANKS